MGRDGKGRGDAVKRKRRYWRGRQSIKGAEKVRGRERE